MTASSAMGSDAAVLYRAARKYSITIAGHPTSIRIEPYFWERLTRAAVAHALPVNALIAQIDAQRLEVTQPHNSPPPNLASALRLWVCAHGDTQARHDTTG